MGIRCKEVPLIRAVSARQGNETRYGGRPARMASGLRALIIRNSKIKRTCNRRVVLGSACSASPLAAMTGASLPERTVWLVLLLGGSHGAYSFYGELILPLPFSRICLLRTRL